MKRVALFFACAILLAGQNAQEIVRRSCELDLKDPGLARNYTYLERTEDHDLDGAGKVKTTTIRTWDVTPQQGRPYRRLVARNDQPLSEAEQKWEDQKLQQSIAERQKESPELRQKAAAEWERKQAKQHEPLKEVPEAFDFKLVGEEQIDRVPAWVIDATPKPAYRPKSNATSFFPKVKGRLWIDKNEYRWVRVEMDIIDTVSFGAFLLRIAKGGHLTLEQTRVNSEVWLPKHIHMRAAARIALVKAVRKDIDMSYSSYRKFEVDSRVVSTGPARR